MTTSRAVASMAGATILSRILGFARVIVIAGVLGTTALGNTFQSTNSISNVLFDLLAAGALSAALVPQLVVANDKGDKQVNEIVSSIVTIVFLVLGTVVIVGIIFAPFLAETLFSRAPDATKSEQIRTGTILLRFFLPQIFLYGIGALAIAVLTAKKKFATTVLAPIGSSLFMIGAIGFFGIIHNSSNLDLSTNAVVLLGIAGTGACLCFVAIPVIVAIKNGITFRPSLNLKNGITVLSSSLWAIAIQASAAIILASAIFIGNKVDGAVVAYQLAFVFFLAPYAIVAQSFSTVMLPDLSINAASELKTEEFKALVKKTLAFTYRPMALVAGVCIALAEPMMRIVSSGRAQSGFELVEVCFVSLLLGLLSYSLFQAASRIYFAYGNIRFPAITVLATSLAVGAVSIVLARNLDGNALVFLMGASHSVLYTFAAIFLILGLKRKGLDVLPDKISLAFIFGSGLYAVLGIYIESLIDLSSRFESIVYITIYLFVTLAIAYVLVPKSRRDDFIANIKETLKKQPKVVTN